MNPPKDALYAAPLDGEWRKSSFSNGAGEDCVQIMPLPGGVAVGDSKSPRRRELRYTATKFTAFLEDLKAGELGRPPGE